MERVNQILKHPKYLEAMKQLNQYEKDRLYCKHGFQHQMDVARIALLLSYERAVKVDKEKIYAVALLHDLGRIYEYQGKCSHESGSIILALPILFDCNFSEEEIHEIVEAIAGHRERSKPHKSSLGDFIAEADTLSRSCFLCEMTESCKWEQSRKNMEIIL
ncbi:HD domain-containing protein [Anaeromicropila populeti]|uniref:HD domain-containing protein n=1 Tax=Anaeromicropila populeti TaxID=37658 RepID=A0A1I6KSL4_9FIRM|nr:HD domain-containing protein [Anaeromicropila populeti]SFR94028.1 HD domain-containing protein [Anaeromicropila populeti]